MILNINIEEQNYPVEIPEFLIQQGGEFFSRLDQDMAGGWQMSREWVDSPNLEQRCQIVADKILGAIEFENKKSLALYSAYILSKMPAVKTVFISTNGEMQETWFE